MSDGARDETDRTEGTDAVGLSRRERSALAGLLRRARAHVAELPHDTAGLDAYLVGGAVRDALLGEPSQDLDFVVVGETADAMLARGFEDVEASSFGVLHDAAHEEWALARTETKTGDGYKGISVETEGVTLRADLRRRDLRMNAMALRLADGVPVDFGAEEAVALSVDGTTGALVDPFGGRGDLAAGRLHHVSEAFAEDPIRVLRAARYAARFVADGDDAASTVPPNPGTDTGGEPFTVAPATKRLMGRVAPELNRTSRDRVGTEVVKAMRQARRPTRFWDVLREVGALAVVAPALDRAAIVPAGPTQFHREGDTYRHTMLVVEQTHAVCERRGITGVDRVRRLLMAVAHDLGKVRVADELGGLHADDPPTGFPAHGPRGVAVATRTADRLGLAPHYRAAMADAAEHHMRVPDLPEWDADRLIEFVEDHDPPAAAETPEYATVDELLDLVQADHQGRFRDAADGVGDATAVEPVDDRAPAGAVQPVFDREPYERRIAGARRAIAEVSGYDVLRDALCDDHDPAAVADDALAGVLAGCADCPTPDEWVAEAIADRRRATVEAVEED